MECQVCGDEKGGFKYGAVICLACTVFFRRSIAGGIGKKECAKEGSCEITKETRMVCRSCRFAKCFEVGLKPEAIQVRDLFGPRNRSVHSSPLREESPTRSLSSYPSGSCTAPSSVQKTRKNRKRRRPVSDDNPDKTIIGEQAYMKSTRQFLRRATNYDVGVSLKLGIEEAQAWALNHEPFRALPQDQQKRIMSEFVLALSLIDQAFVTAKLADENYWILQNNTFLHPNSYYRAADDTWRDTNDPTDEMAQAHRSFVSGLLDSIGRQFRTLKIDHYECTCLKTMIISWLKFPGQDLSPNSMMYIGRTSEGLMEHCNRKTETASQRFGEIVLLLTSIRVGVKDVYNFTKISDLFNTSLFPEVVKQILVD